MLKQMEHFEKWLLRIFYVDHVTNAEILKRLHEDILTDVETRKQRLLGYIMGGREMPTRTYDWARKTVEKRRREEEECLDSVINVLEKQ